MTASVSAVVACYVTSGGCGGVHRMELSLASSREHASRVAVLTPVISGEHE